MKKHKKKILLVCLIFIGILGLNVTVTYSKYVANNIYNYFLNSKQFYFVSDSLDKEGIKNVNTTWDGNDIVFKLKNAISENQVTEYDIKYTAKCKVEGNVDAKCIFTEFESDTFEGTLSSYQKCTNETDDEVDVKDYNKTKCELGNYVWTNEIASKDIAFNIVQDNEGEEIDDVTVTVTITSTEPYKKTLKGTFYVHKGEVVKEEVISYYDSYLNYDVLTISNLKSTPSCQKISFDPSIYRIDGNVNDYETYTTNSDGYIDSITLKLPSSNDIALKFYKTKFEEIYDVSYFTLEESNVCQ